MITQSVKLTIPVPRVIDDRLKEEFGFGRSYERAFSVVQFIIHKHQRMFTPMLQYLQYSRENKKELLTTRFYDIWQRLVDIEVLQSQQYKGGVGFKPLDKKAMKYRLNPGLLSSNVIETAYNDESRQYNAPEDPTCRQIFESLNGLSVIEENSEARINEVADTHFNSRFNLENGLVKYRLGKRWLKQKMGESAADYFEFERINGHHGLANALRAIEAGQFYVARSDLNGRIHHNLTSLPSAALPLLRLDGEFLVELDISFSQPLLLAVILEHTLMELNSPLTDKYISSFIHSLSPPILCSHTTGEVTDVDFFISLVHHGKVYEYFAYKIYGEVNDVTRQSAKDAFLAALFGHNNRPNDAAEEFRSVFPQLYELIHGFKENMIIQFNGGPSDLDKYR